MKTRPLRRLPLLLVVVLAMALGSVGTAAAGGLTTHAVKRIAASVIKKRSKTLTVANARTLAGRAPTAYQESRSVYTVAVDSTTVHTTAPLVRLPVAPGTYQMSYSAIINNGTGSVVECYFELLTSTNVVIAYTADQAVAGAGPRGGLSASGVLTVDAGQILAFGCSTNTTWAWKGFGPAEPWQFTFAPVDNETVTPLLLSRPAATAGK